MMTDRKIYQLEVDLSKNQLEEILAKNAISWKISDSTLEEDKAELKQIMDHFEKSTRAAENLIKEYESNFQATEFTLDKISELVRELYKERGNIVASTRIWGEMKKIVDLEPKPSGEGTEIV